MRLAHLILAYNKPQQLERLVRRLLYNHTDVYIHIDGKTDINEFNYLTSIANVFMISNRTPITWANYSMVTATLNSFEEILAKNISYSHINLLSGQDYPLKSARIIQEYLFANNDKTFMRYRSVMDDWQESLSRFSMYSLGDYRLPFKFKLQQFLNKFLPERKLPMGLKPYGFSQWLTITPLCARFVMDYLKKHSSIRRFFRMTWGVDELIFQTILLNSALKDKVVNDHLRYIKFISQQSRPQTLTLKDADMLTASGKFYARKFDAENDSGILDFLDNAALND